MLRCSFEFISSTFEFKLIVTEFSLHISFSSRKIFGFAVSTIFRSVVRFWCLLRFLCIFALGFRFPVNGKNEIRFSDLLFVAVWCFSVFASDKHASTACTSSRFRFWSKFILVFYYYLYGFADSCILQCPTLRGTIRKESKDSIIIHWKTSQNSYDSFQKLICLYVSWIFKRTTRFS